MALNIPMPESPGSSLLQGLNTGSTMMSRMMQPVLERERLKQQQGQFTQTLALQKQAQARAQALLPYMIQQYKDVHRTAASEADVKELYRNLVRDALNGASGGATPNAAAPTPTAAMVPGMPPQAAQPTGGSGQPPNAAQGGLPPQMGNMPPQGGIMPPQAPGMPTGNAGTPDTGQAPIAPPMPQPMFNQNMAGGQEHELRAGNPRLSRLDSVAGLVPGIPKPVTHYSNGMIFTTYPSGRMTVQQVQGQQTPGEKNVSAKEASKIRDQATALVNSANLVQQGYDILDNNPDLTGPGTFTSAIPIPFTGVKVNLSNNPELGKFKTVTGKLQAELGKYAASRGGIQAVNWAGNVKPNASNPQDYNYGMFEGIQRSLHDDYATLNAQYKAQTGQDLPVPLPQMNRKLITGGTPSSTGDKKVKKVWKLVNGNLV